MYTDPAPVEEPTLSENDFRIIDQLYQLKTKYDADINAVHADMQSRSLDEATRLGNNPMEYFDRLYNEGKAAAERAFLDAAWKVTRPFELVQIEAALRLHVADVRVQTQPVSRDTLRLWEAKLTALSWARGRLTADVNPERLRNTQRSKFTAGVGYKIV